MRFLPIYKSCSFIKSCGKPTITSTTMQERHDNDEIESHNHNEYPLLYKEAEISTSSLGKFLECRKCYILLVTCALVIYLICMPSALGPAALGHTYQANPSCPCYNYYMYIDCLVFSAVTSRHVSAKFIPIWINCIVIHTLLGNGHKKRDN